jgi:hypothetical protein
MDTRDGRIYATNDPESVEGLKSGYLKPMVIPPTEKQMARKPPKVGRNEPCPCGSGKKFKRCCLNPAPKDLRLVEVLRGDLWVRVRLIEVRKGERFRMFERGERGERGMPVNDKKGHTEWVAVTNGFINGKGVGQVEIIE